MGTIAGELPLDCEPVKVRVRKGVSLQAIIHPLRDTAAGLRSYVVASERHCAIIDPLVDDELILDLVEANDYVVDWILLTHDDPAVWPRVSRLRSRLPCVRVAGLQGVSYGHALDRCLADQERFRLGALVGHLELRSRAAAAFAFEDCLFIAASEHCTPVAGKRLFASGRCCGPATAH